ncbi:quercetin 2,3-dioxygenase [Paenarthrobacter sp. A20]|uniref:quercetin 2,3-dioxygenase n=1 Tax=Paenarthrobacter sp. A20 TaxID=2817891 RepID=UPI00209D665A|nr:quercetin 2,3-dioxygenase [Paenarthrobacter sp. A20]MCP1415585.1 quercetin 2,3-dioxygenase [Paenarthrobacter sp. A20]
MTVNDLEAMHRLSPVLNELPGEPVPYYLASGEGIRREIDGQLWTIIARGADTGGLFEAAFILGPRGTEVAFHSLPRQQRSYYVMEGSAQFWLPGQSRLLSAGDSVHVPEGTPVAYRMHSHMTKLLLFSAQSGALDILLGSGESTEKHIYPATDQASGGLILPGSAQRHDLARVSAQDVWDEDLPAGAEAYFMRSGGGEHRAWPDAINSYTARGRNTAGRYFAVNTLSAPQPYIVRHFHQQHTENFLCLSGRIWLWVNGEEVLLTQGDFLHAPAGTIHSFSIAAHNTQMLGLLTGDIFEPFFEATSIATGDKVYTEGLINPSIVMAGLQSAQDLDLVVVGGPPERVRAHGI